MLITGKTRVCAIIGEPVEHSLSPLMQNAAFQALRIDCVYVPFRVPSSCLRDAVHGFRSQGVLGFNVTIPHKIKIIKYLAELHPLARNIGAVNTVLNTKTGLVGYNTDAMGVIEALRRKRVRLNDSTVTILGAGGAARAIVYALVETAHRIVVLNRTRRKARKLKRDLERRLGRQIEIGDLTRKSLAEALRATDLLINATSIGMNGEDSSLPISQADLQQHLTVLDIAYGRSETELLRKARRSGCRTIGGIEMLLHQGAAAFEIWTGMKAPLTTMRNALACAKPGGGSR
jgi:shikimate dehydrogenase